MDLARMFGNEKYMWDGETYASRKDAEAKQDEYRKAKFRTQIVEADGAFVVYTRRVVTEVIAADS